jgi:3-dehydroquinate synthase
MQELEIRSKQGNYPLLIGRGLLGELIERMKDFPTSGILVSDTKVARERQAFQDELLDRLPLGRFVLRQGDESKSSSSLLGLLTAMRHLNLERESPVIAMGGGMCGDLAGLAACLFKRGLPLIQVPTSLLAMADACIGGKVAVNFGGQKNLIGQFWPPRLVLIDLDHLETLEPRERICGFAEILKAAWIEGEERVQQIEAWTKDLPSRFPDDLEEGLVASLLTKKRLVEQDENDQAERRLLNFGHTFAHVIEEESDLHHGEAVLLGMRAAVASAEKIGLATAQSAQKMSQRMERILQSMQIPKADCLQNPTFMSEQMRHDKKVNNGTIRLVLPACPGDLRVIEDDGAACLAGWNALKELK